MAEVKKILKGLLPPILLNVFRVVFSGKGLRWSGNYSHWKDALKASTGYDDAAILAGCKSALLQVKNGEKRYERDNVVFDEIEYSWGLLAGLQHAAIENGNTLCVLDFGGSLGSTYFQNRSFLAAVNVRWCIVEQSNFVDCGQAFFGDDTLKFYHTIEECLAENTPNVLLFGSVLQYLEEPKVWLKKLLALDIPTVILDRTGFVDEEDDRITIQNVPQSIYNASYPCWFFNRDKLINVFKKSHYTQVGHWDSPFETNIGQLKGFIFSKVAS